MREPGEFAPLDWTRMPLDGRVLIEASAGTGKTHNIGLIWLRLLLERGLLVQQILVTTFTEVAAQELRERLRRRLVEIEHWLRTGEAVGAADDDALLAHFAEHRQDETRRRDTLRRIELARADFDRAPISTIHTLCLRIQKDFPFDAGASFEAGAPTDGGTLLRECVEDFWRRRFLGADADEREVEAFIGEGPDRLRRDIEELLSGNPHLVEDDALAQLDRLMNALRQPHMQAHFKRLIADDSLYARKRSALQTRLREIYTALMLDGDVAERLKGKVGECLDEDGIGNQWSSAGEKVLADHPLIHALRQLRQWAPLANTLVRGKVVGAALAYCKGELPRRAQRRDLRTFNMLIDDVHARIVDADGRLATRLAEAFPAALIDEFQDTDARQFEIFERIFSAPDGTQRGLLVMIGDPKQAIFGFRGGDIFAYLKASAALEHRYVLLRNHRSSRTLVAALNALYAHDANGFGDASIRYRAVTAAGDADKAPYALGAVAVDKPLQLHHFSAQPLNPGELEIMALADCADRIAELLGDPARTLGARRVDPGDIAVLLPKNVHIGMLRELLVLRRVPCVGSARESVLQGDTARDLRAILYGVLNADDERAVRGALASALLGASYADLVAWQDDVAAFEAELERFAGWRELVRTRGVLALIDALVERYSASWLGRTDGERRITDVRHLGELLAAEAGEHHGLEGLYTWLVEMSRDAGSTDLQTVDARKPRIETEYARVQLMTMHNAKGLEFPIVFLPLAWHSFGRQYPRILKFHDAQGRECADAGSVAFAQDSARHFREDLEERQRLLYVALTRAAHALHVYWSERKTRGGGDPARTIVPLDLLLQQAQAALGAGAGAAGIGALDALPGVAVVGAYDGATLRYRAPDTHDSPRAARSPLPRLRPLRWLHSFSSLTRKVRTIEHETVATDETDTTSADAAQSVVADAGDATLLALQYQRGPRFGDALHALLEHAAPGAVWPAQRALLVRTLQGQGLRAGSAEDAGALEAVGELLDRVRASDIGEGIRLADLAQTTRVAEFEFQFPLQRASVARLRAICAAHGHGDIFPAHLAPSVLDGMLTGFVDLVFAHGGRYHVLDYKSNWLGARLADYEPAALGAAMREHHYELQALLYTVALHRYLRQRLDGYTPEAHLGDSWYLFLRGIGLAPGLGVWRRRWPAGLIRAVDELCAGAHEALTA